MSEGIKFENGEFQAACPACGKTNAVPLEKIHKEPVCGSCKSKLTVPDGPVELTDETFQGFIDSAPVPVLVDFWAPWCGPCRMMGPILENFARKKAGQVIVAKLNTDASRATPGSFGIQAIPTLIVFKNGKEIGRKVGALPEAALEGLLPS